MGAILTQPVVGPVAWSGREIEADRSWIYTVEPGDIAGIEAALDADRSALPPALAARVAAGASELAQGRGMFLMRGLPVERWGEERTARALWLLGTALGRAIPQNARGELIGHVRDDGSVLSDPNARGYQTRAAQSLHVDRCDLVGLLCLNKARSGGISRVVSSMRIYNEMLARCPWYLGVLYRPFAIDLRGEEAPGQPPVYYRPVFSFFDGVLSCGANATYIRSGQERVGQPLRPIESEALDAFYATAEEHAVSMELEPGDLQLLNSYVTLHDRTAYEDHLEPERKRHLLRIWLETPVPRPLAPDFGSYDFAAARVVGSPG
jgi:Taurine catabolism dioxygenase TauD, TfdA family